MKYAVTDYDGCEYITAGKRYEVRHYDGVYFYFLDDHGDIICTSVEGSNHLNGNDWRIEMNNDVEKKGNDFEVKYDEYETPLDAFEGILSSFKDIERLRHEEVEIVRAALQKQPEKSDVTRSDIDLRDWYAGQALQGLLAVGINSANKPNEISMICYNMATAMMEARKNK